MIEPGVAVPLRRSVVAAPHRTLCGVPLPSDAPVTVARNRADG